MMLTINAASNGHVAKQLIAKLQLNGPGSPPTPSLSPDLARPNLIAIHSKSDFLTGSFGTVGRRILHAYGGKDDGVFPGDKPRSGPPPPATLVNRSTPANLLYFDNLCFFDGTSNSAGSLEGDTVACDDLAALIKAQPSLRERYLAFRSSLGANRLQYLYRRIEYNCRGKKERQYVGDERCPCAGDESTEADFNALPWNKSAYWLFNVPHAVVGRHDGFWTPEMQQLFTELNGQFPILTRAQVLQ